MKKTTFFAWLLVAFACCAVLFYSGWGINRASPEAVARRYFAYIANQEWFLTYDLHARGTFDSSQLSKSLTTLNFERMKRVEFISVRENGDQADLTTRIVREDDSDVYAELSFEKIRGSWYITASGYHL